MRTDAPTWYSSIRPAHLPQLIGGIAAFGFGIAATAQAQLGLGPWSVLHQGMGKHLGVPMGTADILVSVPLMLLMVPLGARLGLGTLLMSTLLGLCTNVGLMAIPAVTEVPAQLALLAVGIAGTAYGSGLYLAADMGSGPRDGIMTGLHHRTGWPIGRIRTAIELVALGGGWLLGGTVGAGTLVYAIAIGPLVERALALSDRDGRILRRTA